ncbi:MULTISPECIES: ABC transporter permease subunit [Paeniglutamicibacter]|uniref:Maltose/maltodextrin transport system permease protein n=1 Tax=Paeniglutamicibacter sulfureus TaxID=43666 RepID=A0ABU2BGZ3_9MICC|nr:MULTISPECIES: ABC transporter permease subunit [Paeniglutamicibacter]MCV9993284.1 ABC transporter permease subunit [Paeniglutamicibacter sp. ZC-3]MDO2933516.1 ABC transporter permease subunit [Paeniglutamicibacter sulfureus]MDR7357920.1 arabinogalactan oligomer/maltooligosaccharide transport system permease protein [Paeniglutamicibacter sulfureus]
MVEIEEKPSVAPPRRHGKRPRSAGRGPDSLGGILAKIILLGITDAVAAFILFQLALSAEWMIFGISLLTTLVINWIYLRRGGLPAKYLAPGIIFLLVFQVFVMIFSTYIAFTNYGDGHNSTKADAIASIQLSASERVPDSPQFPTSVLEKGGSYFLLVTTPEGEARIGSAGKPLETVTPSATGPTGAATGVEGYTTLDFATLLAHQQEITALTVPISENPEEGALKTADGSTSYVYTPKLKYDANADTFTDTATGASYADNGRGSFVAEDGTALNTGWKVNVGLDNFQRAFTDPNLQGPLLQVIAWTFAFAILSVATTFALGLFLAITFNRADLKGQKIYRILMILPYAFPAFLSGLVWSGLLNPEFGFINNALLGGADIPWLTDPVLAKISVLMVNLWLGYPYMFLVCTGALQSLPEEVDEAARMDGASVWKIFTAIKLPLLLVSLAPLLISSFAFNFNNFNVIYMLTGGGPRFEGTTFDIGSTDILITMVYKIAFGTGTGRDYGLASALAILIFIIVAVVSALSFKKTKALEELN